MVKLYNIYYIDDRNVNLVVQIVTHLKIQMKYMVVCIYSIKILQMEK